MKRDFQEEYQNYIESDMPDLWSRIEPNLKEKNERSETEEPKLKEEIREKEAIREKESIRESGDIRKEEEILESNGEKESGREKGKVLYFIKRAVPAAACLCALVIGIGVMRISKNNSADKSMFESASEEAADAGMAYEAETEAMDEGAAEEETALWDESFDDAAMNESAAPAETSQENREADNDEMAFSAEDIRTDTAKTEPAGRADMTQSKTEVTGEPEADVEDAVEIERAVLYKIAVASEEMQEMGYAYVYSFRLEDESSLKVYLTKEQCDDIEDKGIEIKRKESYSLSVCPFKSAEIDGNAQSGEGILKKIEKMP